MKTFTKQIALWSLLVLSLNSCKKDLPTLTEASGFVFDYYTNEPVKNIKVQFYANTGWPSDGGVDHLAETFTKDDGSFYLRYWGKSVVGVEADSHFGGYGYLGDNRLELRSNKTHGILLKVQQEGKILYKIKNVNPYDNNDRFKFWSFYHTSIPENSFYGMDVDTSFFLPGYANTINSLEYSITKNGVETSLTVDLFLPLDSVPVLEINY